MTSYAITHMITDTLLQRTSGLMQWRPLRVELSLIQSSHHPSGQPSLHTGMTASYFAYDLPVGARRYQILVQVVGQRKPCPGGRGPLKSQHHLLFRC